MHHAFQICQRLFALAFNLAVLWFLITVVLKPFSLGATFLIALLSAYLLSAYFLLPRLFHLLVFLFRRSRIPRYTLASDGIVADPVNVVFFGSQAQLLAAFRAAGWHLADRLSLESMTRMAVAFLWNRPYAHAPFSSLYLFARRQDYGFQQMIGDSPRQRHHVRFWAANITAENDLWDIRFWLGQKQVDHARPVMWVGAASKDIGFGFQALTYQITHRVERTVDQEREHVIDSLLAARQITDIKRLDAGLPLIGPFITDGRIVTAWLNSLPAGGDA